jgi:hypothetical protein
MLQSHSGGKVVTQLRWDECNLSAGFNFTRCRDKKLERASTPTTVDVKSFKWAKKRK